MAKRARPSRTLHVVTAKAPARGESNADGYAKPSHSFITVAEAQRMIDYRVALLLGHFETDRRAKVWYRRLWALLVRRGR